MSAKTLYIRVSRNQLRAAAPNVVIQPLETVEGGISDAEVKEKPN